MKAKKTTQSRRRISFAVDRDEIEINSDWVEAVMGTPQPAPVAPFPAPPDEAVFFEPSENTATDAENTPGKLCTPVEDIAPVAELASVAEETPVAYSDPVAQTATVAPLDDLTASSVDENAPVVNSATGTRVARPRPILRVTDGLTPGQYAVYSLMYQVGQPVEKGNRIYKGGYADLGRLTGLSKRGLQNIIAELQVKSVLTVHQQPGYHRSETSAYMVPPPESVLASWHSKGWRHALGKSKVLVP